MFRNGIDLNACKRKWERKHKGKKFSTNSTNNHVDLSSEFYSERSKPTVTSATVIEGTSKTIKLKVRMTFQVWAGSRMALTVCVFVFTLYWFVDVFFRCNRAEKLMQSKNIRTPNSIRESSCAVLPWKFYQKLVLPLQRNLMFDQTEVTSDEVTIS